MRIQRAALEAIIHHAEREAPRECCGLLAGRDGTIERVHPARNLEASSVRFTIDPADQFAAMRAARTDGLTVVAAYHSHPTSPPVPSPTDIKLANDPELLHVIVSLAAPEPEVRAFRVTDQGYEQVALKTV